MPLVKVTLMLADAAQAADGKLYIMGGGWSVIGPDPAPTAIAVYIQVPWDRTNVRHSFRLDLVDSDGQPIAFPDQTGLEQPVVIGGDFEVGRPVGVKPGSYIDVPLAINIGPLPLDPGRQYEWRLTVDEESREDWRLPFATRPGN